MTNYIKPNTIIQGDNRVVMRKIQPDSIACSIWSPPYHVGKDYEVDMSFKAWKALLQEVLCLHLPILKPGVFLVVNIADILCFKDPSIPRIMADNKSNKRRSDITREIVLKTMSENPGMSRYQIAKKLNCSEQTVDRRLKGNNIRGGKYETQTRVKIVGGMLEEMALNAGLYPYDRRIWVKDAAWENSRWHSNSYRSVDEFEYIYMFWKPGTTIVDRSRLSKEEWVDWGSRAVWNFPSVRSNDDHSAKFPLELPRRIIRLLTEPGDTILDCFLGSGTSAVAAIHEERSYIGIELDPRYAQLAQKHCLHAEEMKLQEIQQGLL